MLSQLERLSVEADGRYATDAELQFIAEYLQSFNLRVQTYVRIQAIESTVIQEVQAKMQTLDPTLLRSGSEDLTGKWKRDTLRVLRYSAVAMLLNDPDTLRERMLFWMQSMMRAFGAQRSCNVTYEIMQDVFKQHLTPPQANLFCPILELDRRSLGIS